MAEELLDRIGREIGDRKQAACAAYEESRRLEAALAALDAAHGTPSAGEAGHGAKHARGRRRTAPQSRAPRGENRRRILEAVAQRPGATAAHISQVTEIARPTAASTLG